MCQAIVAYLGLDPKVRLRQIDFLDREIALLDAKIAHFVLGSREAQRLMTMPGIDVTSAAALIAAVGDIRRFATPRARHAPPRSARSQTPALSTGGCCVARRRPRIPA
jgi:hypothetical protein